MAKWRVSVDKGMESMARKLDLILGMRESMVRGGKGKERMLPFNLETPHISIEQHKSTTTIDDMERTHSVLASPIVTENTTTTSGPSHRSVHDGLPALGTKIELRMICNVMHVCVYNILLFQSP